MLYYYYYYITLQSTLIRGSDSIEFYFLDSYQHYRKFTSSRMQNQPLLLA